MVRSTLKYTYLAKKRYWRFRHKAVGDVPLPGNPGDPEFHTRYAELLELIKREGPKAPSRESFAWLVKQYRQSIEFNALRSTTKDDYERTLDLIVKELGDQPFRLTTRKMIKAVRDDFAAQPRKAHKIKQMASRLYSWADEGELVPDGFNPAAGIKKIKYREDPYVAWSEEEIDLFVQHAPEYVLTPVMLALYTGQRAADVAAMTWTQVKGQFMRVRQDKTGEMLDIPCHPKLIAYLTALEQRRGKSAVVIALGKTSKAFTSGALSNALRRSVADIPEMPRRSLHGLRYAAAARLEEAGCTIEEITSILGHRTYQMGMKYATQRKQAERALAKQQNHDAKQSEGNA